MFVVFVGPPGAGKGTQAQRLSEYLGIRHLSTGEILRAAIADGSALGLAAQEAVDAGQLVPDSVVTEIVCNRLAQGDCQSGCLLDGFPRTLWQAESLGQFLNQAGKRVHLVLSLQVDEDELTRRLLARGRADDTAETIRNRLRIYASKTELLLAFYERLGLLRTVSGCGAPDEVFSRIQSQIDAVRPSVDKADPP